LSRGFTLLEVVVALAILEATVLGVIAGLALSARTTREAELLETAVAVGEGVLDSLAGADSVVSGVMEPRLVQASWVVDDVGNLTVSVSDREDRLLFSASTWFPR
jgi:type II secretory pathway pseudopilin PulG